MNKKMNNTINYINRKELMRILKVKSSTTITTYIKQGMPCIKINERMILFDLNAVIDWLSNQ